MADFNPYIVGSSVYSGCGDDASGSSGGARGGGGGALAPQHRSGGGGDGGGARHAKTRSSLAPRKRGWMHEQPLHVVLEESDDEAGDAARRNDDAAAESGGGDGDANDALQIDAPMLQRRDAAAGGGSGGGGGRAPPAPRGSRAARRAPCSLHKALCLLVHYFSAPRFAAHRLLLAEDDRAASPGAKLQATPLSRSAPPARQGIAQDPQNLHNNASQWVSKIFTTFYCFYSFH